MENKMGKLFVIEGTDGSGKQTQVEKLEERFDKEGIQYKKVSFPNYDSPTSTLVKMYLAGEFGENAQEISPYIASTFYAVDRYGTYQKELRSYYEAGEIIIADRYTTANMVHQAGKIKDDKEREKFLEWLCDLEFNKYGLPRPTKAFFLNMPPEYALKLMKNRENKITHKQEKDIHEKNKNHIIDSYQEACKIVDKYDWYNVKCVKEGEIRTIEDIHEEIYSELIKYL